MRRIPALLVAGLFAASLAAPAIVIAAPSWGNVIVVQPPNGTDDTANIQNALNSCVGKGPSCTVQLQAGTYKTSQLVEYNFNGTFKGMGEGVTTIAALPDLLVTESDFFTQGECAPNITNCRWSSFITFADGNVEVSDLSLDFPWTNGHATTTWTFNSEPTNGLGYALGFTADGRANASVDHVSVTGRPDTSSTSILGLGFNVMEGIVFDGYFPSPPPGPSTTYVPRSGSFTVRNSSVRTIYDAVVVSGAITSSQVSIVGNRIDDGVTGIDVGGANSTFDISYNNIAATNGATEQLNHSGVLVEPGFFAGLVSRLSQVSIHDNTIAVSDACGCMMVGVWLQDANQFLGAPAHWFRATVMHNSISLPSTFTLSGEGKEGMDVNNITGTVISGNTFTGTSDGTWDAISLWGNDPTWLPATNNVIIGNDVRGLMPEGSQPYPVDDPGLGLSQYYLDPYTNHNLVVCTRRADTAYDGGTSNAVIGCTIPTLVASPAAQGVSPLAQPTSPMGRFNLLPRYPVHP